MTDKTTVGERVTRSLQDFGLSATWEYPGYVNIVTPTGEWHIGTANGNWGGDFTEGPTGEQTAVFDLDGTARDTDAAVIAKRIVIALTDYIR